MPQDNSYDWTTIVIVGCISALIAFIGTICCIGFFLRRRLAKTSEYNGYSITLKSLLAGKPGSSINEYSDVKAHAALISYDKEREIPRSAFVVGDQIGSGNFGSVHKGSINELHASTSRSEVAIKSISGHVGDDEISNFIDEVKIMSYVKPHVNLVSMIGACTSELDKSREMWLVIEFCDHGELRKYLIQNKNKILSGAKTEVINNRCLVRWSYDVAKGMQYLSENFIIHGDLAARNILLGESPLNDGYPVAKVADFGLSKKLCGDVKYEKENRTMIPWKWMALELLKHDYLTLRSDVWSYGVLLWEMFSFGRIPYGHVDYDQVITNLENGFRLECPTDILRIFDWSPEKLYTEISKVCFEEDQNERGSFSDVVSIIEKELTQEENTKYLDMCDTYNKHAKNYLKIGTK